MQVERVNRVIRTTYVALCAFGTRRHVLKGEKKTSKINDGRQHINHRKKTPGLLESGVEGVSEAQPTEGDGTTRAKHGWRMLFKLLHAFSPHKVRLKPIATVGHYTCVP